MSPDELNIVEKQFDSLCSFEWILDEIFDQKFASEMGC